MIHTSKQLKDKVRNISHGDNDIAQMMIRNFIMERFLERVSLSQYRKNFILKGGMLVASLVGIDARATMDIDTTMKALPLNEDDALRIATTRMRDFYDVYELVSGDHIEIDKETLRSAFSTTCAKRKTIFPSLQMENTLKEIRKDEELKRLWELYRKNNFYVGDLQWEPVRETVCAYILERLAEV